MKLSRTDRRSQTPDPKRTRLQSQLATRLIWAHSWRIRALPCPVVTKDNPQPRSRLWTYESMRICRKWQIGLPYILLFNERSTPLSSRADMGCVICAGRLDNVYPIYRHAPSPRFGIVAGSKGQRGTHLFPDFCDSLFDDAIICSCSLVTEGNIEGWGSDKGQTGIYWCLQYENVE